MIGYNFTQTTPSTTWTISHGLNNTQPNVDCQITYNGVYQKVIPLSINAIDANNITVTFSTAYAGTARVVA